MKYVLNYKQYPAQSRYLTALAHCHTRLPWICYLSSEPAFCIPLGACIHLTSAASPIHMIFLNLSFEPSYTALTSLWFDEAVQRKKFCAQFPFSHTLYPWWLVYCLATYCKVVSCSADFRLRRRRWWVPPKHPFSHGLHGVISQSTYTMLPILHAYSFLSVPVKWHFHLILIFRRSVCYFFVTILLSILVRRQQRILLPSSAFSSVPISLETFMKCFFLILYILFLL